MAIDFSKLLSPEQLARAEKRMAYQASLPTLVAIRTNLRTGKETKVTLKYEITHTDRGVVFQLMGGPTGYESFYVTETSKGEISARGWCACIGTPGQYDQLFIPGDQMMVALDTE